MRRHTVILLASVAVCLTASVIVAAPASPADSYSIAWWSIDGGGGISSGGLYVVSGSAGQADAGSVVGGNYVLTGGFWGGAFQPFTIYLPVILKAD